MLEAGVDPNAKFGPFSLAEEDFEMAAPLALACLRQRSELMELLVAMEADPARADYRALEHSGAWRRPVTFPVAFAAMAGGSLEVFGRVMDWKADPHKAASSGRTPLWTAAYRPAMCARGAPGAGHGCSEFGLVGASSTTGR